MNCETTSKLISKHWDGELSPQEQSTLDLHLKECLDCRAQLKIWEKYERKLSQHYRSHRLDENFVARMHQRVALLNMEPDQADRPGISGRVFVPALQWLQPIGMAAGLLLAVLLFALRSDSSLGYWLGGQGFLMTHPLDTAMSFGKNSRMVVHPGDVVWTAATQQLQLRLPGDIPIRLSERGLLSLASSKPGQKSSTRLHSGKVALNAPGNHHSFMLDTAAGRIQGEAGRIDVTAEWIALSEKKWGPGTGLGSWTEGWQAVPVATVAVNEGSAEVGSTAGPGKELNPGQQAFLSGALAAPLISGPAPAGREIAVTSLSEPAGNARLVSELLPGENRFLVATTFVNLPLQTILSSVAEVSSSQMELAPSVQNSPRSLRVVRPVNSSAEEVLAAVARFSGVAIERTDRPQSADVMDAAPSVGSEPESGNASAKITLEMEGNSVKLLRGSGVRMSVLAKAIEAAVDSPVDTASADWALGDFELQNIPREKLQEALAQRLGLRFQKETRTAPYYRIRSEARDKRSTAPQQPDAGAAAAPSLSSSGPGELPQAADAQAARSVGSASQDAGDALGSGGASARRRPGRNGSNPDPAAAVNPSGLRNPLGAGNIPDAGSNLTAWANSLLALQLNAWAGPSGDPGSMGSGTASYGQSAASAAGSGSVSSDPLGLGSSRAQIRRVLSLLKQRTGELESSRRIVFPPLALEGLTRDVVAQPLSLLFIGLLNASDQPARVAIRCRSAAGAILDRRDLLLQRREFLLSGGSDLFPDFNSAEDIAYLEAESESAISGLQLFLLGGELQLLPAATVSTQQPLAVPWPQQIGGDQPWLQAILSLTNTSELFSTVQIEWTPELGGSPLLLAQIELAPHQSLALPLERAAARNGAIRVQASQPGLAGFLAAGEWMALDLRILPASATLAREWVWTWDGSADGPQVTLFNPGNSPARIQILQSGCSGTQTNGSPIEIELPAWGSRFLSIPGQAEAHCGLLRLLSSVAVHASRLDNPTISIVAP